MNNKPAADTSVITAHTHTHTHAYMPGPVLIPLHIWTHQVISAFLFDGFKDGYKCKNLNEFLLKLSSF